MNSDPFIDQVKFTELAAQGYNRIPVMREVLADLDTPLSSYLKLAAGPVFLSYLNRCRAVKNGAVTP